MKQIMTVAAFTFKDAVRRRVFIIINVLLLVVILAGCAIMPRLGGGSVEGENYGQGMRCFLLDETGGEFQDAQALLKSAGLSVTVLESAAQLEDAKENVLNDNNTGILHILPGEGDGAPVFQVYAGGQMSAFPAVAAEAASQLNALYRQTRLAAYDVPESELHRLASDLPMQIEYLGDDISSVATGGVLMLLTFFAIYYYGMSVATSVATEKSSRVMETLIVSAKPSRILLGKCLGAGMVSLLQFAGILGFTALCASLFMPDGTSYFQLPELSLGGWLLILLYFILGYALYAMLNSICGAMVSKLEDLNAALMPVTMITLAAFYAAYMPTFMGGGNDAMLLLVPFTSPLVISYQLLSGEPAPGMIAASLGLLVGSIALVSFVSMRVYSASVLRYGQRLRWKEIAGMIKKQEARRG